MSTTNIETTTVKPTKSRIRSDLPSSLPLHGLDLAPVHITIHRFYRVPLEEHSQAIERLKTSLADVLALYPPVAGSVCLSEAGEPYIALDYGGSCVIVQNCEAPFNEEIDALSDELSPRTEVVLPFPSPGLAVKMTMFTCGTLALCTSMHHMLTDLAGYIAFLSTWSSLARGEEMDEKKITQDWTHTPERLFPPTEARVPPGYTILDTFPPPPLPSAEVVVAPQVSTQMWSFTNSSLARLKGSFTPSSTDISSYISTGDALTALICGAISRARSVQKDSITLAMAADARSRSPHPEEAKLYFGNLNLLPIFPMSSPLQPSAYSIRASLLAQIASPPLVAARIAAFAAARKPGLLSWNADVILTNWTGVDFYGASMDYGFGKPFRANAGPVEGKVPPGFVRMLVDGKGGVEALVAVEMEYVERLKADELLKEYATPAGG